MFGEIADTYQVTPSTTPSSSDSGDRPGSRPLPPKLAIPSLIRHDQAPVILAIPHSPTVNSLIPSNNNNLLGVPPEQRHLRSHSLSSVASGASAWTPTPYTSTPASDIGDDNIDVRQLLQTNEAEGDKATPTPFAFTVAQLQELHDPKNLDVLRAMGGIKGLCMGLRTDVKKGLRSNEDKLNGQVTIQDIYHVLENENEGGDSNPVQGTSSGPAISSGEEVAGLTRRRTLSLPTLQQGTRSYGDRKRVFGITKVPPRKSKSIFLLMWLVLQDKTLVLPSWL